MCDIFAFQICTSKVRGVSVKFRHEMLSRCRENAEKIRENFFAAPCLYFMSSAIHLMNCTFITHMMNKDTY